MIDNTFIVMDYNARILFWVVLFSSNKAKSDQDPDIQGTYSVKICSNQFLDQSQQTPCPPGTVINVTSITFGVRVGDDCSTEYPSSFTCLKLLEDEFFDEFRAWKQSCDGKIVCDNLRAVPSRPVTCGAQRGNSDFIGIAYDCLGSPGDFFPDIRVSTTCVGSKVTDVTCPHDYRINIIDIYAADNPQLATCEPARTYYSCVVWIPWPALKESCNSKANCSDVVVAKAVRDSRCATGPNVDTDYIIIQYRCLSDVVFSHRCHGYTFDDLFCADHEVLQIGSVSYGDIEQTLTDEQCRGGVVHDPCYVTRTTPYRKKVFRNCDGRVNCSHEAFIKGILGACFPNREPQFVLIGFRCAYKFEKSTLPGTTSSMTTPISTMGNTDTGRTYGTVSIAGHTDTDEESSTASAETVTLLTDAPGTSTTGVLTTNALGASQIVSMEVTIIVASAAGGGVLLVVLIVVTIVCVRRKRQTKSSESEENRTEQSPNNNSDPRAPSMEVSITLTHNVYSLAPEIRDNSENEAMSDGNDIDPYAEYNGTQPTRDDVAVTQETDVTAPYSLPNKIRHTAQQPINGDVTNNTDVIYSKARSFDNNVSGMTAGCSTADDATAAYSIPQKDVGDDEMIIVENDLYHSGGFRR